MNKDEVTFLKKAVQLGYISENQVRDTIHQQKTSHGKSTVDILLENKSLNQQQVIKIGSGSFSKSMLHSKIWDGQLLFQRYRIIKQLGRGGMGIVYQVQDLHLKRIIALKMLLETSIDEVSIKRFLREIQTCAKLKHPNLIEIYDSNVENDRYFFTMECIEGKSLKEYRQASRLTTSQIVNIMKKTCAGVAYAHSKGIIHRDLKPHNIMIDKDKNPKVMDFGLAKWNSENTKISKSGAVVGTLVYMSPEQLSGKKRDVDTRSDIYSLGAILYELLTDRPPFQGSYFSMMNDVLNREPKRPSEIKPNTSKDLEAICIKAMAKKKENRYKNLDQMVRDLNKIELGQKIKHTTIANLQRKHKRSFINITKAIFLILLAYVSFLLGNSFSLSPASQNLEISSFTSHIPKPLWDTCWKKEYFDFTEPLWKQLAVKKQIEYMADYQKWYAQKIGYKRERTFYIGKIKVSMVFIPPGKFEMGQKNPNISFDKKRDVTIFRPFYISKRKIKHQQYTKIFSLEKSDTSAAFVTWQQATNFCNVVGAILPTEAQWEYAYRAGLPENEKPFSVNPWKLSTHTGNLSEWCLDRSLQIRQSQQVYSFTPQTYAGGIEPVSLQGTQYLQRQKSRFFTKQNISNQSGFRCILPVYVQSTTARLYRSLVEETIARIKKDGRSIKTTGNIRLEEDLGFQDAYGGNFLITRGSRLIATFTLPKTTGIVAKLKYKIPIAKLANFPPDFQATFNSESTRTGKAPACINIEVNGKLLENDLQLRWRGDKEKVWILPSDILQKENNTIAIYQFRPSANVWFYELEITTYK